ncbi:MAG: hypothetical protein QM729_14655 [Solirubrobacterales bacterium]
MRATVIIGAIVAMLLAGCGGGSHHAGPTTFDHLADWLEQEGECEGVEAEVTHLPISRSRAEEVAPINLRFDQATVAAVAGCGGVNGYISYYRFTSSKARADAVRGREGLMSNELFCVHGPELVVNGLLGHDQTAPFCKRLGFKIHRPTRRYSAAQKLEHHLEFRAADLVGHITGAPTVNVECRHTEGLLRFECEEIIGGTITQVDLVKKGGRYVVKGCEDLGTHRTENGSHGETCALPGRQR